MGDEKQRESAAGDGDTYRRLMDSLPIGLVVTSPEGILIEANPAFVDMFGYSSRDEIRELGASELYCDPDDREKILTMLKSGAVKDYEANLKRKDGTTFWGSFNSIAKMSSGGEPRIYTALQDITKRRKAEDRLRMLGMALEQTIDGVIVTDLHGKILFVNRAFASMHWHRVSDLIGKNQSILHTKEQLENECKSFNRELMLTGVHQGEIGRKCSDGSTFATWTTGTLLRDQEGDGIGFVKTVHNITEQKAVESRMQAIKAELENYVHAVSHDLRARLSAISVATITLRDLMGAAGSGEARPGMDQILESIEQSVGGASTLIDDLLSLSEAGHGLGEMSDVDVGEVVTRILEGKAREVKDKGVSVEMDRDLGQIFGNPQHVYDLFYHLIVNAITHNDNEAPSVTIRHLGEDQEGTNTYLIRDNGSGINPDAMDKIFLPFYRGKGEGTGVGLSIVKKIIDTYNGEIRAHNDNGACFEFSI